MIGWIAFAFTCIGVILMARKNIWCWLFLIIANFLWAYHLSPDLPALAMQATLFGLNIYGFLEWSRN
jgi:nicotinamide riboside transporter PnuC